MTILEYLPLIDARVIWSIKNNFLEKYNFLIDSTIKNQNPKTEEVIVTPFNEYSIKQLDGENRFEYEYWRKLDVVWYYSISNITDKKTGHLKFDFWAIGYIHQSSNFFSSETIDPYKYHLKKVQELRINTALEIGIPSLLEYKSNYIDNEFITKFNTICKKTDQLKELNLFSFSNELVYISQDLSNILAELYLFRPYLRSFLEDPYKLGEVTIYRYSHSFYDKQYFHLASSYIQNAYNFWDRIGDLLYHYFEFPGIKREQDVYFNRIIDQFPDEYKTDDFHFLYDFLEKDYKVFNKNRKDIVHNKGLESKMFTDYLENVSDYEGIKKLQEWKEGLIEDLLSLHNKSFEVLERALKLIENKDKA